MELTRECAPIVNECLELGVLINCTAEKVLRFIPPLIVHKKDIDQLVHVLEKVLGKLTA
jgi:acetylornithine/succinyldiaminopimelate/putrescine aminotransferase